MCLIRVDSPFVYDEYVAPVCIWPFPIWDNEEVYLGGWGNLEENGNTPDQLQEVQGSFNLKFEIFRFKTGDLIKKMGGILNKG